MFVADFVSVGIGDLTDLMILARGMTVTQYDRCSCQDRSYRNINVY